MTDLTREATTMKRMAVTGWGHCTPEGVVTNDVLATVMDTLAKGPKDLFRS